MKLKKYVVPPSGGQSAKARMQSRLKAELRTLSSGFTMIELLVVLAIIVVLATISIPTIQSMTSPKHMLRKEGLKVMQLMGEARSVAIARKVKVGLYTDPAAHELRMIEVQAYASVLNDETNAYEKVVVLQEEFELGSFSIDEIQNGEEENDPFQKSENKLLTDRDEAPEQLAVSFSHFGGSDGGGISLTKDGVRLDIAADILTGRPKIVKRVE